jgi:hypothetical protein
MTVTVLPREVRDYIGVFGLAAVCAYRDGRLGVSRNPEGAGEVWWCLEAQAGAVVKRARRDGDGILAAAGALGIPLTAHASLINRAKAASGRIDAALCKAQRGGDLGFFNSEYRARRQAAAAAGRGFMSYQAAQGRLRSAIAGVAAGQVTTDLLARVFDDN